ncbi:MAG: rRNA pseudouridine synthase [candidate division Zixibacteria bacterium]|nr:rRNA pseudouridine synthase [candidate division Zixibacteria bacterium]
MRLNKFLAGCGVASRRKADELIAAGKVRVNGTVEDRLGVDVDPTRDAVTVEGRPVRLTESYAYYAFHKPTRCLTTVTDPFGRATVMEYLRGVRERVFPVGRLDFDTEGLLLFSNDGAWSHTLLHPRFGVEKEYRVLVEGVLGEEELRLLRNGVPLPEKPTAPARVVVEAIQNGNTWLNITIHEGKKRQIRNMMDYVGHPVTRLLRTRIGPVRLCSLTAGKWRSLTQAEVAALREVAEGPGRR